MNQTRRDCGGQSGEVFKAEKGLEEEQPLRRFLGGTLGGLLGEESWEVALRRGS